MAYDNQVGDSLNYGQSMQPGKTSSTPSYMQYQMNQYGPTRTPQQPAQPQQPQQGQPVMPNGQPPVAQWQPTQQQTGTQGSVDAQGVFHAGTAPQAYYQPRNIQQFQGPDTGNIPQYQQQMVENLMNNPYSMSPQVLSQMKGQLRNQATLMNQQQVGDAKAALAARGISPSVGYGKGEINGLNSQMNANLLNQFQGLDVQAAQQNRQDLLQAMNAGNEYQNSALARAVQGYGAQLSGEQAAGSEQEKFINSLMQNYQMGNQALGQQSQSTLQGRGLDLQSQGLSNEMQRFNASFGLQENQFDWQKQQDLYARQQQQAAMAAQAAAQRQAQSNWEDQQAYQYMTQGQPSMDSLFAYLMGGGQ